MALRFWNAAVVVGTAWRTEQNLIGAMGRWLVLYSPRPHERKGARGENDVIVEWAAVLEWLWLEGIQLL